MSPTLAGAVIVAALFAGLCAGLAYRLYLAGVDLITLKAELADADKAHADTTAHMLSGRRLNAQLLQELTRVRADRSRAQDERDRFKAHADKLAHAAAHLLVNRFQMPVIDGWHAADEDVRQAAWDPSPVYDALVREHPREINNCVWVRVEQEGPYAWRLIESYGDLAVWGDVIELSTPVVLHDGWNGAR